MIIDGKKIAENILSQLKIRVEALKQKGVTPHLYIITFGDNPNTQSYLKQKLLRADQIGAKITIKKFDEDVITSEFYDLIDKLNTDTNVNGIIVQRPLIQGLDEKQISDAIILQKDVDGFRVDSTFGPPVALAVIRAIEQTEAGKVIEEICKNKKISIIGKGITAGGPTIKLFNKLNIPITVIDSKTNNREEILKNSDILISAVGKQIIKAEDLKEGVILIGIGMHTIDGKLKGDYEESEIKDKASFYTPTPGGIGPVNVAMLMKNLVEATENQLT